MQKGIERGKAGLLCGLAIAAVSTMASAQVPEPSESANQETLESALRDAGFVLRPLAVTGTKLFRVEKTDG